MTGGLIRYRLNVYACAPGTPQAEPVWTTALGLYDVESPLKILIYPLISWAFSPPFTWVLITLVTFLQKPRPPASAIRNKPLVIPCRSSHRADGRHHTGHACRLFVVALLHLTLGKTAAYECISVSVVLCRHTTQRQRQALWACADTAFCVPKKRGTTGFVAAWFISKQRDLARNLGRSFVGGA